MLSCFAMRIMNILYDAKLQDMFVVMLHLMTYYYYLQDIDQRVVIEHHFGINKFDLIRAAHFSNMSAAQSNKYYPEQAPES